MTLLARRYAHIARRPYLRLGLRLVSVAGCVGFVYFAHWGLPPVLRLFHVPVPAFLAAQWRLLSTIAVSLLIVGATIPQWGPWAGRWAPRRRLRQRRALRRLRPLWLDLTRSTPEIPLVPPSLRWRECLDARDLDFRLYRRVIEIRDGQLALLPFMDESVAATASRLGRASGLEGDELEAVVEASRVAAALDAKLSGQRPDGRRISVAPPLGGQDVSGEVAILERVAAAYVASPVVRQVVAATRLPAPAALERSRQPTLGAQPSHTSSRRRQHRLQPRSCFFSPSRGTAPRTR